MNVKEIGGQKYKMVEGTPDSCEGCVADNTGNCQLCVDLGMDCLQGPHREMVWVLEVE